MRKTQRRKLYGRSRRRQRGKGLGKAVCAAVLVAAIASLPAEAKAKEDLDFRDRVSIWWNNPNTFDTGPSVELAKYITDMKWAPSLDLYPETCETARGVDEAEVVAPYLDLPIITDDGALRSGQDYSFTKKDSGEVVVATVMESIRRGEWKTEPSIDPTTWNDYEVRGPIPRPKDDDDDPFGGRRSRSRSRVSRKSRRKTLRRK
jgi:hypothetical protein